MDTDDQGYQLLSDEEIVQQVTSQQPEDALEDENEEDEAKELDIPSSGEVTAMLDRCLLWYEWQQESTATSVLLLKRIRDLAATKRFTSVKQTTLDSYFY